MSNDMNHHIKVYRNVFIGLLILTIFTVGASYIEFNVLWLGVAVGLLIAFVKGYLVAANFMHLNNEKSLIYMILGMTFIFFLVLFFMPLLWHNDGLHSNDNVPFMEHNETIIDYHHNGGH